jgi:natural product precursor
MKKIKLNALESQRLNNKEMNKVRGRGQCDCAYANSGGSSTGDNNAANEAAGKRSSPDIPYQWTQASDTGSGSISAPVQSAGGYTPSESVKNK